MTILTREQLLEIRLPTEEIDIPWLAGAKVRVRALPAYVQSKYVELSKEANGGGDADVFTFLHAVVDENGKRLYQDSDKEAVQGMDLGVISLVSAAAWRLTRLSPEKQEAIKKNLKVLTSSPSGEQPSP